MTGWYQIHPSMPTCRIQMPAYRPSSAARSRRRGQPLQILTRQVSVGLSFPTSRSLLPPLQSIQLMPIDVLLRRWQHLQLDQLCRRALPHVPDDGQMGLRALPVFPSQRTLRLSKSVTEELRQAQPLGSVTARHRPIGTTSPPVVRTTAAAPRRGARGRRPRGPALQVPPHTTCPLPVVWQSSETRLKRSQLNSSRAWRKLSLRRRRRQPSCAKICVGA